MLRIPLDGSRSENDPLEVLGLANEAALVSGWVVSFMSIVALVGSIVACVANDALRTKCYRGPSGEVQTQTEFPLSHGPRRNGVMRKIFVGALRLRVVDIAPP